MSAARAVVDAAMSEREYQEQVIQLAESLGYVVSHVRDSRRMKVEDTPDLMCVRPALDGKPGRIVFLELKDARRPLTDGQAWYRDLLLSAGGEVYSPVRPADYDAIALILAGWGPLA